MKEFIRLEWDANVCLQELERFRNLLRENDVLTETTDISRLFRECLHLSAMIGELISPVQRGDLLAFEYDLFGDFSCDLVIGNSRRKAFVFVEFEDAGAESIFKRQGKKATRDWSPRFDHGYSQIIDWFCKLRDMEKSDAFATRFGARSIDYAGVLIVGREHHLELGERRRLEWRRSHVIVDSHKIECFTLDELLEDLSARIQIDRSSKKLRRKKS